MKHLHSFDMFVVKLVFALQSLHKLILSSKDVLVYLKKVETFYFLGLINLFLLFSSMLYKNDSESNIHKAPISQPISPCLCYKGNEPTCPVLCIGFT